MIGYPLTGETPFRSDDAFADPVERWSDAGFDELIVHYPPEWHSPPAVAAPGVFERAFTAKS